MNIQPRYLALAIAVVVLAAHSMMAKALEPIACEQVGPAWHIRTPYMQVFIDTSSGELTGVEHTGGVCHLVVEEDGTVGAQNSSQSLDEVSWCQDHRARKHASIANAEADPNWYPVSGIMTTWLTPFGDCKFFLDVKDDRDQRRRYDATGHIIWPGGALKGEATLPGEQYPLWFFEGTRHGMYQ